MCKPFKMLPSSGIVGRKSTIEITVPDISWLGYMFLSCHVGSTVPCVSKHATKDRYHISFTATHPAGLHGIQVQVRGDPLPKACDPCNPW